MELGSLGTGTERRHVPWILAALSLAGSAVVAWATSPRGVGLGPDSVAYVRIARNLLAGNGYCITLPDGRLSPVSHFPPLYPALLAALGSLGLDPVGGARWLGAVLFGLNILMVGMAVHVFAPQSAWLPVLAAILTLGSVDLLKLHLTAWTEPLFLLLGFTSLFLITLYARRPALPTLTVSAILAALAVLVRYPGVAVIGGAVLAMLLLGRRPLMQRLEACLVFILVSILPLVAWLVRNYRLVGNATNRELAFHPPTSEALRGAMNTVTLWVLPASLDARARTAALIVGVVLVAGTLLLRARKRRSTGGSPGLGVPTVCVVLCGFLIVYLLFLAAAVTLFDKQTPLDARLLSPVYVASVIMLLAALPGMRVRSVLGDWTRPVAIGLGLLVAAACARRAVLAANEFHRDGYGYSGAAWRESPIMAEVRSLSSHLEVVTNAPDAIYALTGRNALRVPETMDPNSGRRNDDYAREIAAVRRRLDERRAVLIFVRGVGPRAHLPSEEMLVRELALRPEVSRPDGVLYTPASGLASNAAR